ncbi:MAG: bile acid:sodium symporter [bacterium]|nr:MAG: bile acid:sodium symporter [bacterium]
MLQARDGILLFVIFTSITTGILYPGVGEPLIPYPKYFMMALLFLSFVSLQVGQIFRIFRLEPRKLSLLIAAKLLILPVVVYFMFHVTVPRYALAALLLSGVSTGVLSPFFSIIVGANTPLVLSMVVTSSLLVPFSLPFLVKGLTGSGLELSLWSMIQLLSMVVFVPIVLVELVRKWAPKTLMGLEESRFTASLVLIAMTNLGVFSKYSEYFRAEPGTVLAALGVACFLAIFFFLAGLACTRGKDLYDQLSVVICFAVMNNILVLVFASEFFGPLETILAAVYSIPFYGILIPLRFYGVWKGEKRNKGQVTREPGSGNAFK